MNGGKKGERTRGTKEGKKEKKENITAQISSNIIIIIVMCWESTFQNLYIHFLSHLIFTVILEDKN